MDDQFDLLINGFAENNIGIAEAFLSPTLCEGLQHNILQLQQDDKMKYAGIGNNNAGALNQSMRGDKINWLDRSSSNIHEQQFLDRVEAFIEYLNASCYTGINGYEFHYAVYEKGTAYKKHRDQFKTDSSRKFSLICYLNNDWLPEDGGALVMYPDDLPITILPEMQKAVFFKSSEMEHEVLPANRTRMSITGWLKRT